MRQKNNGSRRFLERLLIGSIAGTVGTWGMTVAMQTLFRRLPTRERYPLPPREITEAVTEGQGQQSRERSLAVRTLAAHFAYGAASGAAFTLAGLDEGRPVVRGMVWGVTVWSISYLGWLPFSRILKPATRHPLNRNALMIAAHLVWGGGLGLAVGTLNQGMEPFRKDHRPVLQDIEGVP